MSTKKKTETAARGAPAKHHDDEQDLPWPEFDEKDLENEKWSATDGATKVKEKIATKWPFEDPAGPVLLPPSLQHLATQWKRPSELMPPVEGRLDIHVVSPLRAEKQYLPQHSSEEERSFARMRCLQIADEFKEPEISLVTPNAHILQSELMRWLISHMTFLQREPTPHDAHTTRPWELIYPQRDGKPYCNPGGKYVVKLFWLGTWRRVTIDDTIPLDANGRALLPRSSLAHELWPVLLAKAVCRLASYTYVQAIGMPDFGDASLLQMITGWMRVPYSTTSDRTALVDILTKRCQFPPPVARITNDKDEDPFGDEPASAARSSATLRTGIKRMVMSGKESPKLQAAESARRGKSGIAGDTLSPGEGPPVPLNKIPMVYAIYGADSPVANSDVGLPGRLSHPVRILSCHNIGTAAGSTNPDHYAEENWILELESPLVLFSGRGGFNNMLPNWKVIQIILGTSLEREHSLQAQSLKLRGENEPFPPFRFRMLYKDFCAIFKSVIVLQKDYDFRFRSTIVGSKDSGPTLITEGGHHNDKEREATKESIEAAGGMDLSQGRPWLLFAHSEGALDLVVTFSISQPRSPRESVLALAGAGGHAQVVQRVPETGTLELEVFAWQVPSSGKTALRLSTTGSVSTVLRLPPGRNVFRIVVYIPAVYSISVMADKEFLIASELSALRQMGSCSTKFMHHAFGVVKAIKYIVGQRKEDADEFIRHLALVHVNTYGIPSDAMFVFWRAFVASLETALFDQWHNPLSEDLSVTVGEAWAMLCADLHKEIVAAFSKLILKKKIDRKNRNSPGLALNARKKKMTRLKAVITIQRMFRGTLGRRIAHEKRQERIQRLRSAALTTWDSVINNMVDFSMMLFRRMYDISPAAINLFPFAKDEALRATVKDFTSKCEERTEGEWFVMSQDMFKLAENTTVNVRLHIPSQEEMPQASFLLHIIDNDTGEETPTTFGQPQPTTLKTNKRGYTIMTEVRTSAPLPAFPWGLRVISNPEFPTDPARSGMSALTGGIPFKDHTGLCKPRRETLFRYQLSTAHPEQVVSFQLFISKGEIPNGIMTLELYRGDSLIKEATGPQAALIPFAILGQPPRRESSFAMHMQIAQAEPFADFFIVGKLQGDFVLDAEEPAPAALTLSQDPKSMKKLREKSGKKGKEKEKPQTPPSSLPQWTLRVHSRDGVSVSTDCQREDEIMSIKAAWEACEPGRKERGEQIRQKFLQKAGDDSTPSSGSGSLIALFGSLPGMPPSAAVLHNLPSVVAPPSPPVPATPIQQPSRSSMILRRLSQMSGRGSPPSTPMLAAPFLPDSMLGNRSSQMYAPRPGSATNPIESIPVARGSLNLGRSGSLTSVRPGSGQAPRSPTLAAPSLDANLGRSFSFAALAAPASTPSPNPQPFARNTSLSTSRQLETVPSTPSSPGLDGRISPVGDLPPRTNSRGAARLASAFARVSSVVALSPTKQQTAHEREVRDYNQRRDVVIKQRSLERLAQTKALAASTSVFADMQSLRASVQAELLAVRKECQNRLIAALETSTAAPPTIAK